MDNKIIENLKEKLFNKVNEFENGTVKTVDVPLSLVEILIILDSLREEESEN